MTFDGDPKVSSKLQINQQEMFAIINLILWSVPK